jgi:transposase
MKMTITRCKLTRKQQEKLLEFFVAQTTARMAADLMGVNRQTAILFYHKIRGIIFQNLACKAGVFAGEIEVDESYFGGTRKGKRGRGAAGKTIVFGLLKRGDKVYVQVVDDTKRSTLMPIIADKIQADSIVYTDCYSVYNSLDISQFKHHRINHQTHFAEQNFNHINGIENFWNQAKRVLRKYNGVPKNNFHLFIKECEFRFNYGTPNQQLKTLKKWCLK